MPDNEVSKSAPAASPGAPRQWYEAGLRFGCRRCGACCSGEPGAVWLDEGDIDALAARLSTSGEQFERDYVRRDGLRRRLYEWPTGECVLLGSDGRCIAYDARPAQCHGWPFWRANLESLQAWQQATATCPGCGDGPLYRAADIELRAGASR